MASHLAQTKRQLDAVLSLLRVNQPRAETFCYMRESSTVPVIELELNVSLQSGVDRASSHVVRQLLCEMEADQVAVDILAAVLEDLLRARNHANDVVIVQVRRALPAPDVVLVSIGDNFNLQNAIISFQIAATYRDSRKQFQPKVFLDHGRLRDLLSGWNVHRNRGAAPAQLLHRPQSFRELVFTIQGNIQIDGNMFLAIGKFQRIHSGTCKLKKTGEINWMNLLNCRVESKNLKESRHVFLSKRMIIRRNSSEEGPSLGHQ